MKKILLLGTLLIIFLFISTHINRCSDYNNYSMNIFDSANWEEQGFVELLDDELPYSAPLISQADNYNQPIDNDSIEMFLYRGMVTYHPVGMGHRCRVFINAYNETKDEKYLLRAEKYANKLMEISKPFNNALYAQYTFRYAVHSDSANTFAVPWYSGMAQGILLIDFCRLYQITQKQIYLDFADKLFNSFLALKSNNDVWTVRLDDDGYYWVEEYPHDTLPGRTLNGYNYAISGLYEYYRLTKRPLVKKLFDMTITTIKHYMPEFRVADSTSLYCLGHKVKASKAYHQLHITQMGYLYKLTGDSFFMDYADSLRKDVNNE